MEPEVVSAVSVVGTGVSVPDVETVEIDSAVLVADVGVSDDVADDDVDATVDDGTDGSAALVVGVAWVPDEVPGLDTASWVAATGVDGGLVVQPDTMTASTTPAALPRSAEDFRRSDITPPPNAGRARLETNRPERTPGLSDSRGFSRSVIGDSHRVPTSSKGRSSAPDPQLRAAPNPTATVGVTFRVNTIVVVQPIGCGYGHRMAPDDDGLSAVFAALADPTRRAILARLAAGSATVKELAEPFAMTQQAISKHVKVLEHALLISRGRAAQSRPCVLEPIRLAAAADWIDDHRQIWSERHDRLGRHLTALHVTVRPDGGSRP